MELVISGNYVSYMKQLENNYNNPDIFYQLVKLVVHKIHNRTYNKIELLNIWRKLTAGLLNESDVCKKNILCLLEHKIEFLNYHYDNEPMMNLLKYSDIFIFKKVIYTLKSIRIVLL
jgi:methyltransferase-like protein